MLCQLLSWGQLNHPNIQPLLGITDDVPEHSFVIGRSRQVVKQDWSDKRK